MLPRALLHEIAERPLRRQPSGAGENGSTPLVLKGDNLTQGGAILCSSPSFCKDLSVYCGKYTGQVKDGIRHGKGFWIGSGSLGGQTYFGQVPTNFMIISKMLLA